MRAKRLTDVGIERLAVPADGRLEIWDALAPGLGVRLGTRRKSFFVKTRADGRLRRVTIGSHPGMTIKQARDKARCAAALARNGEDPVEHERFGPIVQLLTLTGQRRDEVARMAWDELDLKAATWTIPAEKNKSARPHAVPLFEPALEIIHAIPRVGLLLFPSKADLQGDRPFSGWSRAKCRLDAASEVSNWRLHDLRRTAATGMARLSVEPHVVERVLNHATTSAGPLARVYQRYEHEAEKWAAIDLWSEALSAALRLLIVGTTFRNPHAVSVETQFDNFRTLALPP